MHFAWTDEQEAYRQSVTKFAEQALNGDVVRRDAESEFPREAWRRCAEFGIQGLPVPERYGGQGADAVTLALALEALGHACHDSGLLFSIGAQMWSCEIPLLLYGTEEQRCRYLPGLCDGSLIGVQAMTEPGSGSDAYGMATTATRAGDGYVLNGSKAFITNAPVADVFVVFAVTSRESGLGAVSAFLIERDTPGLEVGPPVHKMGLRTSPMAELFFSDCEVPAAAMLGARGAGIAVFSASMDWERSFILAPAVGTMRRQVERCVRYARERSQFGQPIGKFQSVANRIVDMQVRLETSRLLVYRLAWLRSQKRRTTTEAAMAKLYISECLVQSSLDALQVHGGSGYLVEAGLERDVRDAVASRLYSGTSEVQRNIVARGLGL